MADSPAASSGEDPDWTMVDKDPGDSDSLTSSVSEPSLVDVPNIGPSQSSNVIVNAQSVYQEYQHNDGSDSDLMQLDEETDDHLDDWVAPDIPGRRCSQSANATWLCNNDSSSDCLAASDEDDDLSSVSEDENEEEDVVVAGQLGDLPAVFDNSDPIVEELPADSPRGNRSSTRTSNLTPNGNMAQLLTTVDCLTTVLLVVLAVVVGVAVGHFHGSERSWYGQQSIKPQEGTEHGSVTDGQSQIKLSNVVQQLLAKHSLLELKMMDMNSNAEDSLKKLRDRIVSLEDENRDLRIRLMEGRKRCTRILHKWPVVSAVLNASRPVKHFHPVDDVSGTGPSSQVLQSIQNARPLSNLLNLFHAPVVKSSNPVIATEEPQEQVIADQQDNPGFFVDEDDVLRISDSAEPEVVEDDLDFVMVEDFIVPLRNESSPEMAPEVVHENFIADGQETIPMEYPGFYVDDEDVLRISDSAALDVDEDDVDFLMVEDVIVPLRNRNDKQKKKSSKKSSSGMKKFDEMKKSNSSRKSSEKTAKKGKPGSVNNMKKNLQQDKAKIKQDKKNLKKSKVHQWQNSSDGSKSDDRKPKPKSAGDSKCRKNAKSEKNSNGYCYVKENKYQKPEEKSSKSKNFWNTLPRFIRKQFTKSAQLERILRSFGTDIVESKVFRRVVEEVPKKLKMSTEFWNCQWSWWNNFARSNSLASYNDCGGYWTSWQFRYRKDAEMSDRAGSCRNEKPTDFDMDFSDKDWFRGKVNHHNFDLDDEDWYLRRSSSRAESRSTGNEMRPNRNSTWWFFGRAKDREQLRNRSLRSSQYDDPQKKAGSGSGMFPPDPIYEFLKQRATWQHGSYNL